MSKPKTEKINACKAVVYQWFQNCLEDKNNYFWESAKEEKHNGKSN